MKTSTFFLIIGLIIITILFYNMSKTIKMIESYQNNENITNTSLGSSKSNYPFSETNILLENVYPVTGNKGISKNGASDIWWHYPIFQLGSYDQITNNIRYSNNPDEGTCMPASMCGVLYKEKQLKSNYIKPLPPINPDCGTRVGYFDTNINLLPFRTDMQNILY